jgi:hypothetical protein
VRGKSKEFFLTKVVLYLMRPSDSVSESSASTSAIAEERRSQRRYPVALELACKLVGAEEIFPGKTADLTNSGVRFHADRAFPISATLELRIQWPTVAAEPLAVELVVEGRVVRSNVRETAVQTICYRFGTRQMTAISRGLMSQNA